MNRTLELDNGRAYLYKANYTGFLEKRAERRQQESAAYRKLQNIYRRELAWIQRGAEARRTKKKDRVERFQDIEAAAKEKVVNRELEISSAASRLGRTVIELDRVSAQYDGHYYIRDFSYILLRNDRVGIVGPNGAGKTTLMDMIAGRREPDGGTIKRGQTVKIGYFSQTSEFPDPKEKVLEYIRDAGDYVLTADGERISAAMMLERFLFPPELQWVPVGSISGGEQRRLFLLRILMEAPNVLLLDEPTNDLDIPTLSVLEEYLDSFPGAVIAVSHDRYFLDRFARKIFAVGADGRLTQYPGGYSDYEAAVRGTEPEPDLHGQVLWQAADEAPARDGASRRETPRETAREENPDEAARSGGTEAAAAEGPRKITFSEKVERDNLEEKIAEQDAILKMLNLQIEQAGGDFEKLAGLTKQLEEAQRKEDAMMERWAYLSELAES